MKNYSKISIIGNDLQELHSFIPDLVSIKKGNFIDVSIRSSKFLIGKHELFNGSESVDFICLDGISSRVELKQLISDINIPEKNIKCSTGWKERPDQGPTLTFLWWILCTYL